MSLLLKRIVYTNTLYPVSFITPDLISICIKSESTSGARTWGAKFSKICHSKITYLFTRANQILIEEMPKNSPKSKDNKIKHLASLHRSLVIMETVHSLLAVSYKNCHWTFSRWFCLIDRESWETADVSTLYSVCVIYDGSVKCGKGQAFINMQRKSYFEELLTTIAPIPIF